MSKEWLRFRDLPRERERFLSALLLLLIAFFLERLFAASGAMEVSFLIVSLIAFSFFLNPLEVFALGLLAAILLGWKPFPGPESLVIAFFPFFVALFRRATVPFAGWILNFAGGAIAVLLIYAAAAPAALLANLTIAGADIVLSSILGFLIFQFFRYGYKEIA